MKKFKRFNTTQLRLVKNDTDQSMADTSINRSDNRPQFCRYDVAYEAGQKTDYLSYDHLRSWLTTQGKCQTRQDYLQLIKEFVN